uniref:GTP-binding protein Parf n=1 Tax=Globodera rostochiensis TaxID=31243 RepID=A0A914HSL3_GLORO
MLNALMKRFAATEEGAEQSSGSNRRTNCSPNSPFPAGINPVGAELRRKFATGIDYNMKILIRGDRNTGKTSLWRRLQGMPFLNGEEGDAYVQTEEIQVASITWNYRARDFVVKLDVWDVVDKGRRADASGDAAAQPLKLGIGRKSVFQSTKGVTVDVPPAVQELIENSACDASTVNVYNGCNGVVMMFDVSRDWTLAYIRRELPSVPAHIPVLVIANKMDLVSSGQPTPSTIDECLEFLCVFNERSRPSPHSSDHFPSLPFPIRFARASMKRAQGLKFLYNFFNIPFLQVQQTFLKSAMEANLREMRIAEDELDVLAREEGQNPSMWRRKSGESKSRKRSECEGNDGKEEEVGDEEEEAEDEENDDAFGAHGAGQWTDNGGTESPKTANSKVGDPSPAKSVPHRRSLSSTSSEAANPHVSTYAEDFDVGENGLLRW